MTKEERYKKWLEIATMDLEAAECMFNGGSYVFMSFACQQELEKLSKGLFVLILQ